MPSVDSALETVKDTLTEVAEAASTGVKAVGSALSDVTEEEHRSKGLAILLILVVLAVAGVVVWRRTGSRNQEGSAQSYDTAGAAAAT